MDGKLRKDLEAYCRETGQQIRTFDAEVRAGGEKGRTIFGRAVVYNSLSEDLGGWRERILPGALDSALEGDVTATYNHDRNQLLGRTSSGTLAIDLDEGGIRFRVEAPRTDYADNVLHLIERRDVQGASFTFTVAKDGDRWIEENGLTIREVRTVSRVFEVGPVVEPAYQNTTAARRSFERYSRGHRRDQLVARQAANDAWLRRIAE